MLEARTVAESASGRNAGFLLQGTAERYARAVTLLGRERARSIHQLSLDNHHQVADFITSHGADVAYQKRGSLQLAGSVREEEELIESASLLRADGFSAVELTRSELPGSLCGPLVSARLMLRAGRA